MTRRVSVALIAAVCGGAIALSVPATGESQEPPSRHIRIERTLGPAACDDRGGPGNVCGYDIGPLRVPGPKSVDVVVTLSFEYRVTSGTGTIRTWFVADGAKWLRMKPGPYRLSSPAGGDWTSTTLTWFRHGLSGGQRYDFHAVTTPAPSADMFARRVVAIIDVRPAGPA